MRGCGAIRTFAAGALVAAALPSVVAAQATADADEGVPSQWYQRLRMAPIALVGNVAYEFRLQDGDEQDRTMSHLLSARLDAASYIWQPWFATVNAGIGVTVAWTPQEGSPATGRDQFVTGRAQVNLFPNSRFPFEAHFDVNDTRAESSLLALPPSRWTRAGFSQSWRPLGQPYSLSAGYDHATQSGSLGDDTQDVLTVSGDARWNQQIVALSLNHTRNTRESTGEEAWFDGVLARHSWQPIPSVAVESTANFTRNVYELRQGTSDTAVLQATSVATWRPQPSPWSGNLTARALATDVNGARLRSGNAIAGAYYDYSEKLRFSASAGLGFVDTADVTQALYSASAGVLYQADTIPLGTWRLDWNTSANASFAGSSGARVVVDEETPGTLGIVSGTFGYALSRAFPVGEAGSVLAVLGQEFGVGRTTARRSEFEELTRISTTASVAWNAGTSGLTGYARLAATDSRDLVLRDNVFQMINLQVSGTWETSRYGLLTGDLTAQWVSTQTAPRDPFAGGALGIPATKLATTGVSASLVYRHQRVFGVPRLRFQSDLRITDDTVVEQDERALLPDQETKSWENRLDYPIGRLLLTLGYRISEVNGRRIHVAGFRIQRDFEAATGR